MNSIFEDILINFLLYTNISEIYKIQLMNKVFNNFIKKHEDYIWKKILITNSINIISNECDISIHYQNYTLTCPQKFSLKKVYISDFHHKFVKIQTGNTLVKTDDKNSN